MILTRATKRNKGFTLIEAIISMLIVTLIAQMYVTLFPSALRTQKSADNMKVATNAAQKQIENIRDEARSVGGFNNLTGGTFTVDGLINGSGTTTIQNEPGLDTQIKRVIVTVTWNGPGNTGGTVTLQTLISSFG